MHTLDGILLVSNTQEVHKPNKMWKGVAEDLTGIFLGGGGGGDYGSIITNQIFENIYFYSLRS